MSWVFRTLEAEFAAWQEGQPPPQYQYAFADGTYFSVIDGAMYNAGIAYEGRERAVQVDAVQCELVVTHGEQAVKRVRINRLLGSMMLFDPNGRGPVWASRAGNQTDQPTAPTMRMDRPMM